MHRLFQPITSLKYVAQKCAKLYDKLDITTPYDLLYHLPRHYMDYRNPISIAEANCFCNKFFLLQLHFLKLFN